MTALTKLRIRTMRGIANYLIKSGLLQQWLDRMEKPSDIINAVFDFLDSNQLQEWLDVFASASDQELIDFIRLLGQLIKEIDCTSPKIGKYCDQLTWLADNMGTIGNPALPLLRRILSLSSRTRVKMLENVGVRGTLLGSLKRDAIEAERGFVPPFLTVISPSMECNLGCEGCYAWKWRFSESPVLPEVLPYPVLSDVCTQMEELGCGFITLSGGEPYLYRDPATGQTIWDLFADHPHIFFQTYTNGTLLADEKVIEKMVALGNIAPAISVEGFEAETVARRGQKTWDTILQAMAMMKEAKLAFGFSATVTRHNVDRIATYEFVDYWIDKGCLFGWTFILIPIGSADVDNMLLPKQRDRLREFTTIEVRKSKPILWFDFWNDGCLTDGCIAAGRHCHILNDGRVTACVFSPFAPPGYNVKDQPILDILEQAPYFQQVRRYLEERKSNPLLPCMVIDEPYHLAWAVQKGKAEPAYFGASELVKPAMTKLLDERSAGYRHLANLAWQEKYPWATAKQKVKS